MQKRDKRPPDEIARDLEEVVLPEISEEDLEEAYGGTFEQTTNEGCSGC